MSYRNQQNDKTQHTATATAKRNKKTKTEFDSMIYIQPHTVIEKNRDKKSAQKSQKPGNFTCRFILMCAFS